MHAVAVIPHRYREGSARGVDVCQVIAETDTGHELAWILRDVLAAAGLPLAEVAADPAHDVPLADHGTAGRCDLDAAWALLCGGGPVAPAADAVRLFDWMQDIEARTIAVGPAIVLHRSIPPRFWIPDRWWTLRGAALLLNGDSAIDIGRTRLVTFLLEQHLAQRDVGPARHLRASRGALEHRLLFERRVRPQPLDQLIPQVLVTAAGITELHRLLGGTDAVDLIPTATAHQE